MSEEVCIYCWNVHHDLTDCREKMKLKISELESELKDLKLALENAQTEGYRVWKKRSQELEAQLDILRTNKFEDEK